MRVSVFPTLFSAMIGRICLGSLFLVVTNFSALAAATGLQIDLQVRINYDLMNSAPTLEWSSVGGSEYFIQKSTDLQEWRLLPLKFEGNDSLKEKAIDLETATFYRVIHQLKPDRPWVTSAATTSLASYQLFYSELIQAPVSYHVYLPALYEQEPFRRFPVLYWLHGAGPGVLGIPALTQYFHEAIELGEMPATIIVFANGLPNGMWTNSKDGVQPVESILIEELIPYIDQHFRTIGDRSGRIVEGFSMGGYGAGRLGLKYPHMFSAVSMMGAGPLQLDFLEEHPRLVPLESRKLIFESVYGNDMSYFVAESPWRLGEIFVEMGGGDLVVRQIVGTADSMLTDNRRLRDHYEQLGLPLIYMELPAVGHNPMEVLQFMGAGNFEFYESVLGSGN